MVVVYRTGSCYRSAAVAIDVSDAAIPAYTAVARASPRGPAPRGDEILVVGTADTAAVVVVVAAVVGVPKTEASVVQV